MKREKVTKGLDGGDHDDERKAVFLL